MRSYLARRRSCAWVEATAAVDAATRRARGHVASGVEGRIVFAVALLAALAMPSPTRAQVNVDTPFGNANDPVRPVPPAPVATGRGIVSATIVEAGKAEIVEREDDGKPLAAVALDVRLEGGSTTPGVDDKTVTAELASGETVPLYASCVPAKDDAVEVRPLFGVVIGAWTVRIDDRSFECFGRTARLAMMANTGPYHLLVGGAPSEQKSARIVLIFTAQPSEIRRVRLPGGAVVEISR